MLEKIMDKNGKYYIADEHGNNILPKTYDYLDLQEYGIVARNSVELTFLDNTYDFYDLNGMLLFSKYEKHISNYVTNNYFYFEKNYIVQISETTADYDKWDHDTSHYHAYMHLDGSYFNVPKYLDMYYSNDNICILDSNEKGEVYYYDINKQKTVFRFDEIYNKANNMIKDLNHHYNKKLKKLIVKRIYQLYEELIDRYPIDKETADKLKDELNEKLKLNFEGAGFWELEGYHSKTNSYYCKQWYVKSERQYINIVIDELNEEIDKTRYKLLRTNLKVNVSELQGETIGHQLKVNLLKNTEITTLDNALSHLTRSGNELKYHIRISCLNTFVKNFEDNISLVII